MKKVLYTGLVLAAISLSTSCSKDKKESFSDKLSIEVSCIDNSGTNHQQSTDKLFTIESGANVAFTHNIGGENGFGNQSVEDVVASFEITEETARGSVTQTYRTDMINSVIDRVAINEDVKYTFTLTSKDGEKSVVGPIEFKVVNNQKIAKGYIGASASSLIAPLRTQFADNNAEIVVLKIETLGSPTTRFFTRYTALGAATQGGNVLVVSPHRFQHFGAYPSLTSVYSAGWNNTIIQPYTGSIDWVSHWSYYDDFNSYTELDNLNFDNPQSEITAAVDAMFQFQTPEGKKGLGVITAVYADGFDAKIAYQK